jgi:hypothetical protein
MLPGADAGRIEAPVPTRGEKSEYVMDGTLFLHTGHIDGRVIL